jgi:NADPH:quinone reductase-like Zn-dependent oxidoreductase
MKAIVYDAYGSHDILRLNEVETPVPHDNEVLVKVKAASINSWDWDMIRGEPIFVRLWGLTKPKYKVPGADIAGIVEAVGTSVTKLKPGDEVFGDLCESGWGGFAEYATAKENALAIKPSGVSFEHAAAIPQAGLMALQSIGKANLSAGQRVLFNGAAGGVGTFAVQMCKSIGAEVTAVDAGEKLDLLTDLGADHVIDYRKEDFTKNRKHYDLIIDVVSNRTLREYRNSLSDQGNFIMVGGTTQAIFQCMLMRRWMSRRGGKRLDMLAYLPNKGLDVIAALYQEGKVKPVIDKCYPLAEIREAFEYFASGAVKGKIVITGSRAAE